MSRGVLLPSLLLLSILSIIFCRDVWAQGPHPLDTIRIHRTGRPWIVEKPDTPIEPRTPGNDDLGGPMHHAEEGPFVVGTAGNGGFETTTGVRESWDILRIRFLWTFLLLLYH